MEISNDYINDFIHIVKTKNLNNMDTIAQNVIQIMIELQSKFIY